MNRESGNSAAVDFLGRVVQRQPEILGRLSDRNRYILFAHSDQTNKITYQELGDIFGVSRQKIGWIYKRYMEKTFERALPEIQHLTPLTTIFEDASDISDATRTRLSEGSTGKKRSAEVRARIGEQVRSRWSDPEYRTYIGRLNEARREARENSA